MQQEALLVGRERTGFGHIAVLTEFAPGGGGEVRRSLRRTLELVGLERRAVVEVPVLLWGYKREVRFVKADGQEKGLPGFALAARNRRMASSAIRPSA